MENEKKKKKRIFPKVLAVIAVIIALLACFIGYNSHKNVKEMNSLVDIGLDEIKKVCSVTEVDAGEFSEIKMYGIMKFHVKQYDIENFGNLSVMTVNMGMMQMASFVVTPFEKDAPLLSMDFMYIFGSRKCYTEYYDLTADKTSADYSQFLASLSKFNEAYSSVEDIETKDAWYDELLTVTLHKKLSRKEDATVRDLFRDSVSTYIAETDRLGALSDDEKAEKLQLIQQYSDNLVDKGGISTDVFKKQLGADKTKEFFNKVFFGTERAKAK